MEARQGISPRPLRLLWVSRRLLAGGTEGNRRLTAMTATMLLALLAGVAVRQLLVAGVWSPA
ncbi:MAG TPA: hypothetical protein VIU81_04775 [Gaiellaceae bacterium]